MYIVEIKLLVLKLVLRSVKDNSYYIIWTCQVHDFYVVHDAHKHVLIDVFDSFNVKQNKILWKIIW